MVHMCEKAYREIINVHVLLFLYEVNLHNRRVSQMRAILATCRELVVDDNKLPNVLHVF